jgi:hypothetical protein
MTSQETFIATYENMYSNTFCNRVINYYEDARRAGFAYKRGPEENTVPLSKSDESVFPASEPALNLSNTKELFSEFNSLFWNVAYPDYVERFGILKTFEQHTIQSCRVQKTAVGEGYHAWHCENGSRATSSRILAWSLFLNDVEEGGETEFLYQHLRIKPKQGTLTIWPASFTHTHRGNPPLNNTKYILTGWVEY